MAKNDKPSGKGSSSSSSRPKTPPPGVPAIRNQEAPTSEAQAPNSSPVGDSPVGEPLATIAAALPASDSQATPLPPPPEVKAEPPTKKDPNRRGRFLLVDLYPYDLGGKPNYNGLATASDDVNNFVGAVFKASEGTTDIQLQNVPYKTLSEWLAAQVPAFREAGGDRLGVDWFFGFYHFVKFNQDGRRQGAFYSQQILKVCGDRVGMIRPWIDVELGSISNSNHHATAQQVVDVTSACVEEVRRQLGCDPICYGRGAMRDLKIQSIFGCRGSVNPSYTTTMQTSGLIPPLKLTDIIGWQYTDGMDGSLADHPKRVPGFGRCDITVAIQGDDEPKLDVMREQWLASPG